MGYQHTVLLGGATLVTALLPYAQPCLVIARRMQQASYNLCLSCFTPDHATIVQI